MNTPGPEARGRARWRSWPRRIVVVLSIAYPLALLATIALVRVYGERWWPATSILYLPRFPFALPLPFLLAALAMLRQWPLLALQALSAFLAACSLMGFVLPWPVSKTEGAPSLRVLSCNIDSTHAGEEQVIGEIEKYSPDVALLQEIGPLGEALARHFSTHYQAVRVAGQFLVASRHPIASVRDEGKLPFDGNRRSARFMSYAIETPLGRLAFYNLHPISPREAFIVLRGHGVRRELLSGRLLAGANAPQLLTNVRLRSTQIAALAALAAGEPDPVVIAGDTNLPGLSPSLRFLSDYQDGFTAAGWGFGYTFPTYHRPWMRIDRIFASRSLRFVNFLVGGSVSSDHRCVVADLQRRSP